MRLNKNKKRGSILLMMTLIMVVAAVYVTTALFDVRGTIDQERLYKTKKHMGYLQTAISDFRLNNPGTQLTAFSSLVTKPVSMSSCGVEYANTYRTMQIPQGWCGPYLDTSLFLGSTTAYQEDAWGTTYTLSSALVEGEYVYSITSSGENMTFESGGGDDIQITF